MKKKFIILLGLLLIYNCVAQPFTPFPPPGKKKSQAFPLILPPTTRTTGCEYVLSATNITSATGVVPVVITLRLGVTPTSQINAYPQGTNLTANPSATPITSQVTFTNTDATVARIDANGLVTALKVGTTSIYPTCSPAASSTFTVNVTN
jgi:hypothetical protein